MVAVASGLNLTCDIPVTADSAMDGHPGGADPPRNNFKGKNQSCKTFEELNINKTKDWALVPNAALFGVEVSLG